MAALYECEYKWAKQHPQHRFAKNLLSLAGMYARFPEHCTLGLIEGAVNDIRGLKDFKLWKGQESLI